MHLGRIPGYKRTDVQLLPTQTTKYAVWENYVMAHGALTVRIPSYRSFCFVWQKYMPHLIITTPRSDLCWTCQRNSMAITAASNKSETEKIKVTR